MATICAALGDTQTTLDWLERALHRRDPPIPLIGVEHLRILKRAHLVVDTPVGNRRLYAVDPEGIDRLRAYVDRFWTQALDAFKTMAEHTAVKE